ncbi:hypothetical protein PM724_12770 [Erysipelatoclostridium ramosum]|uniref:hypothetical protein n=1 Tax=Thomasclavelia ramosa TaxID=1547 RepID=UPI001E5994C7|nr:hypothetical protein [Thomasclavelia ramosa]MDB7094794.1 hypothetical protein [Thomasclavelia ramosa]
MADKTTNFKKQLANPFSEQTEETIKDSYIFDFVLNAKKIGGIWDRRCIYLINHKQICCRNKMVEFEPGFAGKYLFSCQ